MSQDKELLAEHLANLALLHMALKGAYRATRDHAVAASEFAHIVKNDADAKDARYRKAADAANEYASRWIKTTYDRKRGGDNRAANSPKQKAKAAALELWKERHEGKHPRLRTVEQFATEVRRRWPVLESHKVICGWSASWSKAMKIGKIPAI